MLQEELYTAMDQIENYIYISIPLFGEYSIIPKAGLCNKFKRLYELLPQELVDNKEDLSSFNEENIFSLLNKISFILENSKTFFGYLIINKKVLTNYLDQLFAVLPETIKMCQGNDISVTNDTVEIEIPDFLKKDI